MIIQYGINRRRPGKQKSDYEHQCDTIEIPGSWEDKGSFDKIIEAIQKKHPGWAITGFCPKPGKRLFARSEPLKGKNLSPSQTIHLEPFPERDPLETPE